jgi:hypothetical protein
MSNFIYTIIVFIILNIALYFGQEWYYSGDIHKAEILKKEIDSQKYNYIRLELQLNQIKEQAEKTIIEEEWNVLRNKYNKLYTTYENILKSHNENVEEYNKLVKNSGTRWYVIPIPWGGKRSPH